MVLKRKIFSLLERSSTSREPNSSISPWTTSPWVNKIDTEVINSPANTKDTFAPANENASTISTIPPTVSATENLALLRHDQGPSQVPCSESQTGEYSRFGPVNKIISSNQEDSSRTIIVNANKSSVDDRFSNKKLPGDHSDQNLQDRAWNVGMHKRDARNANYSLQHSPVGSNPKTKQIEQNRNSSYLENKTLNSAFKQSFRGKKEEEVDNYDYDIRDIDPEWADDDENYDCGSKFEGKHPSTGQNHPFHDEYAGFGESAGGFGEGNFNYFGKVIVGERNKNQQPCADVSKQYGDTDGTNNSPLQYKLPERQASIYNQPDGSMGRLRRNHTNTWEESGQHLDPIIKGNARQDDNRRQPGYDQEQSSYQESSQTNPSQNLKHWPNSTDRGMISQGYSNNHLPPHLPMQSYGSFSDMYGGQQSQKFPDHGSLVQRQHCTDDKITATSIEQTLQSIKEPPPPPAVGGFSKDISHNQKHSNINSNDPPLLEGHRWHYLWTWLLKI